MATQDVNGWMLGLDFDINPFKNKSNQVEKILRKLGDINTSLNSVYQTQLDKQLTTLRKQESIIKNIRSGKSTPVTPTVKPQIKTRGTAGGSTRVDAPLDTTVRPKTKTRVDAPLDVRDRNAFNRELQMYSNELSNRFKDNKMEAEEFRNKIKAIQSELRSTSQQKDLKHLRKDFSLLRTEAGLAEKSIRRVTIAQNKLSFGSQKMIGSIKNLSAAFISIYAVIGAGKALFNTAKQLDSVKSALLAGSGSAKQAALDFGFLRKVSLKFGTDLLESARGYSQLAIAAKEAGMGSNQMKEIFVATTEIATAFGLSMDESAGTIKALTQMLSKGNISMEELRGQMG